MISSLIPLLSLSPHLTSPPFTPLLGRVYEEIEGTVVQLKKEQEGMRGRRNVSNCTLCTYVCAYVRMSVLNLVTLFIA